jgi:hypothetical protein
VGTLLAKFFLMTILTTPTAAADAPDLKPGVYKGPATVTRGTDEVNGRLTLTIKSVGDDGKVKAVARGSNGLAGTIELTGTIDENGVFRFQGSGQQVSYGSSIPLKIKGKGRVIGNTIKGTYNIEQKVGDLIYESDAVFEVTFVDDE